MYSTTYVRVDNIDYRAGFVCSAMQDEMPGFCIP